jgi:hypothetical protein
MSRGLIRIGVFCLVLGSVFVSPLLDLLPVDASGFLSQPKAVGHFRVVPANEELGHVGVTLVVAGLVLLCAGVVARRRGR